MHQLIIVCSSFVLFVLMPSLLCSEAGTDPKPPSTFAEYLNLIKDSSIDNFSEDDIENFPPEARGGLSKVIIHNSPDITADKFMELFSQEWRIVANMGDISDVWDTFVILHPDYTPNQVSDKLKEYNIIYPEDNLQDVASELSRYNLTQDDRRQLRLDIDTEIRIVIKKFTR